MSEDDPCSGGAGGREVRDSVMEFMRNVSARPDADSVQSAKTSKIARADRLAPSFESLPEFKRIEAHQRAGEQLGIDELFYRPHEAAAGAVARIDGRELINFASYDYLGLNQHHEVIARAKSALDRYAVSASASRLVGGERVIHRELETSIAALYGVEAALTFVSGYLTNCATISCLTGPEDLVIHDELIHNSVLAGIKLSGAQRRFFKHNDVAHLDEILQSVSGRFRRTLVIVEGVYSMDGDIADLPALLALRSQHGFWLMIDEAHALGVLGESGCGTMEHFGCDPASVDIIMGTLSKSASSCGGYIAGSHALISILKGYAGGFVYSVGLAPALAVAALASLELMLSETSRTQQLKRNSRLFLELAHKAGLDTGLSEGYSVIPVLVGDSIRAAKLSNELFLKGVNVLPIIYPAVPEGLARLRFFITSEHTPEQLQHAVDLTARELSELVRRSIGLDSVDVGAIADLLKASKPVAPGEPDR